MSTASSSMSISSSSPKLKKMKADKKVAGSGSCVNVNPTATAMTFAQVSKNMLNGGGGGGGRPPSPRKQPTSPRSPVEDGASSSPTTPWQETPCFPVMYPSSIQSLHYTAAAAGTSSNGTVKPSSAAPALGKKPTAPSSSTKIPSPPATAAAAQQQASGIMNNNNAPTKLQRCKFVDATSADASAIAVSNTQLAPSGSPIHIGDCLDGDVLRVRDVYHLKPEQKLAVGKYVPDPSGAPPPGKGGSAGKRPSVSASGKRRSTAGGGGSNLANSTNTASQVYGSAGSSMLRLRRRGSSSMKPGGKKTSSQPDSDGDADPDDQGDDGDDQGDDGENGRPLLGEKHRRNSPTVVGDVSDSDDNDGGVPANVEGEESGVGKDAIAHVDQTASYKLLRSVYPFPISCDTLYFPTAYPAPTTKDTQEPRGVPKAINKEIHGHPHDDLLLHQQRRVVMRVPTKNGNEGKEETGAAVGVVDENGTERSPTLTPLFSHVTIKKGNLNKIPLYKIGPNAVAFKVVINAFESSGAVYTPHSNWNILWAKRATADILGRLGPYQKVNHFPGAWGIGRKDSLHRNVAKMKKLFGSSTFDIVPVGFIIPTDAALLEEDVANNTVPASPQNPKAQLPTYICKPVASSCGKGISLCIGMPAMPAGNKNLIVQRYVGNPYLVDGRKFDLRIYCCVTSFNPLRIYLFDQGLVRFAAERYPGPATDLSSTYKHLTNYSVSKTAQLAKESKGKAEDTDDPIDIKWALSDFKNHLKEKHGEEKGAEMWTYVYDQMKDVVIKAFLSIEPEVNSRLRTECRDPTGRGCFEMYGLDLMLDDECKVYMIECNIMPSLATGTSLDKAVKSRMLAHMLTMVGVVPYARRDAAAQGDDQPRGTGISPKKYFYPPPAGAKKMSLSTSAGAAESAATAGTLPKNHHYNEKLLTSLESLTDAERMMLLEADEEYSRRGGFDRIFPQKDTNKKYFGLFPEGVNRNNYLMASWIAMQSKKE